MDTVSIVRSNLQEAPTATAIQQALSELLKSVEYAERTGDDRWEFAVGIQEFYRLGLSDNDLRLLVRMGFLDHASEITCRKSRNRKFRPTGKLTFTTRTCFVLTPLGVAKASCQTWRLSGLEPRRDSLSCSTCVSARQYHLPVWNAERRLLIFRGRIVKQFKRRAVNQELVLATFQEENWPARIDDPLAPKPCQDRKWRLHDTIKCLNRRHKCRLVQFYGDGTGEGVIWSTLSGSESIDCA